MTSFCDLKEGDWFIWKRDDDHIIAIKIAELSTNIGTDYQFNAVCLNTGEPCIFESDDEVKQCEKITYISV